MSWDFSNDADLIDAAAGIIANVGARNGEGWEGQHQEWQDAAREWMRGYGASAARQRREKENA